jgi:hypothetical protein
MDEYYIGDQAEIHIRPPVPAGALTGSGFTADDAFAHGRQVFVIDSDSHSCSLIVPSHTVRWTTSSDDIVRDVQALVDLLGGGYTYSGELDIVDPGGDSPSRVRVVQDSGPWKAVEEAAQYVFPADYAIPDGPAVVFDPDYARERLTGIVNDPAGPFVRASVYHIDPGAMFDPVIDISPQLKPGDSSLAG